ncbi:hypothetical protein Sgleb_24120 [Streptomyces glebosus]|uniref:AB hydrolase-1 domain-containing protein n=1 Tax=Streptomyces glebosus TaxID=249580 RepID=A0A640SY75_9ACTN|nr:hypothetical protein Sgleb_24120 [Streptomyces glebosus]GHG55086.1 hypothetical protein GCM10010513_16950 [Streptomyces glebosus]
MFRGLGLTSAALLGHSYGGWLALSYAGHAAPGRVNRLVLLDPTQCFAGFRPSYLLRALPLFVRPGERSTRRFLEWETGGAPPAPELVRLMGLGAVEFRTAKVVTGPRPDVTRAVPTLLLLAGRSRTHDPRRVAARAERALAGVRIATLAGVTHHSLPYADPEALGRQVLGFLPAGLPGGTPLTAARRSGRPAVSPPRPARWPPRPPPYGPPPRPRSARRPASPRVPRPGP